jgi:hypothetical protein
MIVTVNKLEELKEKLDCHLVCLAEKKLNSEMYGLCFNDEEELISFKQDKILLEYNIAANLLNNNFISSELSYELEDGQYIPVTTTTQQLDNCITKITRTVPACVREYFGLRDLTMSTTTNGSFTNYDFTFLYGGFLANQTATTQLNIISYTGTAPNLTVISDYGYNLSTVTLEDAVVLLEHIVTLYNGTVVKSRLKLGNEDGNPNYAVVVGEFNQNNTLALNTLGGVFPVATVIENMIYTPPATTSAFVSNELETVIIQGELIYSNFYMKNDCVGSRLRRTAGLSEADFSINNTPGSPTAYVSISVDHLFENLTVTSSNWTVAQTSINPVILNQSLTNIHFEVDDTGYILLKNTITVNTGSTFEYIVQVDINKISNGNFEAGIIAVTGYFDTSNRLFVDEISLGISNSSGFVYVTSEATTYISEPFTTLRTYSGFFKELVGNPQFGYSEFLMDTDIVNQIDTVTDTVTYIGCDCPTINKYPCLDKVIENINTI